MHKIINIIIQFFDPRDPFGRIIPTDLVVRWCNVYGLKILNKTDRFEMAEKLREFFTSTNC